MTAHYSIARLRAPAADAPAIAERLGDVAPAPLAVTTIPADAGPWTVEALFAALPDRAALAAAAGIAAPMIAISRLADRDWVAESLRGLGAIKAGRFRVIGSHLARGGEGPTTLRLDAGRAFGSGHHETTQGCLRALDLLARRGRPGRVLDLGCGSGVLSLAAARIGAQGVLAADVDPIAVRTTAANARANGVAGAVRARCSDGFAAIPAEARFDLILANILAEPLKALAPAMRRFLAPGGLVVLSGLLAHQEAALRAVYRANGFVLERRIALGRWPTLMLRRG